MGDRERERERGGEREAHIHTNIVYRPITAMTANF